MTKIATKRCLTIQLYDVIILSVTEFVHFLSSSVVWTHPYIFFSHYLPVFTSCSLSSSLHQWSRCLWCHATNHTFSFSSIFHLSILGSALSSSLNQHQLWENLEVICFMVKWITKSGWGQVICLGGSGFNIIANKYWKPLCVVIFAILYAFVKNGNCQLKISLVIFSCEINVCLQIKKIKIKYIKLYPTWNPFYILVMGLDDFKATSLVADDILATNWDDFTLCYPLVESKRHKNWFLFFLIYLFLQ